MEGLSSTGGSNKQIREKVSQDFAHYMGKDKRGTGDSMRHKLKITEHSDNHRKR
jgi:hypothetical protein